MIDVKENIKISSPATCRNEQILGESISFGRIFSDHMFTSDYENGKWNNHRITAYEKLALDPSCLVFHYGQAIFEGMKAYKTKEGKVQLFRPQANIERFNKSAERMCMPTFPEELFLDALKQLVKMDSLWVPEGEGMSLYIRPFMIATDEYLGVRPSDKYKFLIITSPVGSYYKEPVKVKIETYYTRAMEGGTGFAKAAGNYAKSLYPAQLAFKEGYHQLLWTDAKEHKYIEESGTMNVMFVLKGNKIITPALTSTILNGVTRSSVIEIAKSFNYNVEERRVSVDEIIKAMKNGELLEAFGTGTAATIANISAIGLDGENFDLPARNNDSFSSKALKHLDSIRRGVIKDPFGWIVSI